MANPNFNANALSSNQGVTIDIKRIAYQALRYWYLVLMSLAICLAAAYLRNRYAVRIYPVTASIIIKETEEAGGVEFLYKNSLMDPYRNYLNELYIIKSFPLIRRVIEDLNFEVSFFKEGNFLTTEMYGGLAFSAKVLDNQGITSRRFNFTVLNKKEFQLSSIENNDSESIEKKVFSFGEVINFQGLKLIFSLDPERVRQFDDKYVFVYQSATSLTDSYVNKLSAKWAEEGAGIINLSVIGPNPSKDIDFLNGLINRYQKYDLDRKNVTASQTIEFIDQQLRDISDSLQRVENMMEKFKDRNSITDTGEEAQRLYEKLELLDAKKTDHLIHGNYYDYLTSYIKESSNLDLVIAPSSVGIEDPVLGSLISRMVDLQLELKMTYGKDQNPLVTGRVDRLLEIKKDVVEAVKNLKATDGIKYDYLRKQISDTESALKNLPSSERTYISIKRNYSLLENLYVFLLQKRSEAGISKASSSSDIAIVNPPMKAGGAITPNPLRNYVVAALLGGLIPVLFFVLLEVFNTKIQSKEDIERIMAIPFIGGIGHKQTDDRLIVINNPKSAVAESFRSLRTNLNYFLAGIDKPVILVSSSISGEGKTFTSINLASVVAMSGKKTLIVGADMRKPRIYNDFDLNNDIGLSSYLAGLVSFEDVVRETKQNNLFLISGGPVPPNPAELLIGERIKKFLEEAKATFDYIIIDTPPIAIVTDAMGLVEFADHTVFIVRQNHTPKHLLNSIKDYYESGRITKISLLLNDIYKSGPGYGYGYGYSYGYGYGYGNKNGYGYYSES